MAIVTISRGCFSHGEEIAGCVAAELGYECISQELLLEASQFFHVSEKKLFESLHDAPGYLERITHARQRFIDGFRATLLENVVRDNVVYHGFAGQILLQGIAHVFKVRVIADMEERIRLLQSRQRIAREAAVSIIQREDQERAEWYRNLYRIDMNDPSLYDIVVHIDRLTIDDACGIVCQAAAGRRFMTTPQSQSALADLAVESRVKLVLDNICKGDVACREGIVHIRVQGQKLKSAGIASADVKQQVREQIRGDLYDNIIAAVSKVPGVKDIDCSIDTPYYV
jgi:cytidylate kinase